MADAPAGRASGAGSDSRLRILVLSPFPPRLDAPHGGGRAIAHLVHGLSTRHEVALLALRAPDEPRTDPQLAARCARVHEVARPGPPRSALGRSARRARLLLGLLAGRPMWVTDFAVPGVEDALRELLHEWSPDLIQVEFHVMAQYFPAVEAVLRTPVPPRVLTAHEPGTAVARERTARAAGLSRLLALADARAWARYEARFASVVQAIVVFTERDRKALAAFAPAERLFRIPLATPLPAAPLSPTGTPPPRLLFFGNFVHPPNVDSAWRLAHAIFPRVRERVPDARLVLIGDQPPEDLRAAAGAAIDVPGLVPDLTPYLDAAALVVVPLRQGGGMRVKVLEALGAGKAVVASRLAVEGLDVRDGEHVALAESDGEFAAAAVRLLEAPDERAALAGSARAWAEASLRPERATAAYEMLYHSLVNPDTRST